MNMTDRKASSSSSSSSPLYESHPPLDLTSDSRRRTGILDVHGDSSPESSESNSDVCDFKNSTQKSGMDSEGEQTTSTISPGVSEERLIRIKSEDVHHLSLNSPPDFAQGHSIGRFMSYVHQMNSMALMRQQYLHHNFPQSHLGPPPSPLLPQEIIPNLGGPQFNPSLARSVSVPATRKLDEKQTNCSKPPIKDESYFERRRKNNEAAKRSRDLRRIKEEDMAKRAKLLENDNSVLRAENNVLRFEIRRLHSLLSNTLNNPER